jgi:predicted transcriptional regulator
MTHLLELSPDLEAKLQSLAAQRGADPDATALQVLADGLRSVPLQDAAPQAHSGHADTEAEALLAALISRASALTAGVPPLADDAVARLYREREDAQR